MTAQVLTPTAQVADSAGLDITALLAAPTQTVLQFTNSGREVLYVAAASGSPTVTTNVGALVDGQSVTSFNAVTLSNANHVVAFGPFRSVLNIAGTSTMQVTLSTTSNVTVALVQNTGVI